MTKLQCTFCCRNLTDLMISSKHIEVLPLLPPNLEQLYLRDCKSLRALPALPHTLQELLIIDCETLDALPSTLSSSAVSKLICITCKELKRLPQLPQTLLDLHLIQCSSLQELPALPEGLVYLKMIINEALEKVSCKLPAMSLHFVCSAVCNTLITRSSAGKQHRQQRLLVCVDLQLAL
jgi:hypothetical protein